MTKPVLDNGPSSSPRELDGVRANTGSTGLRGLKREPSRPQGPDWLARTTAGTLILWGAALFAFAVIIASVLADAEHPVIGSVIVAFCAVVGVVFLIYGLVRKTGAHHPADGRYPYR